MRRSTLFLLPLFALSLAACSKTGSAIDGAGFELLTPSPASRQFIIANDLPFARQVAGHNRTCQSLAGCNK